MISEGFSILMGLIQYSAPASGTSIPVAVLVLQLLQTGLQKHPAAAHFENTAEDAADC